MHFWMKIFSKGQLRSGIDRSLFAKVRRDELEMAFVCRLFRVTLLGFDFIGDVVEQLDAQIHDEFSCFFSLVIKRLVIAAEEFD